MFLTPVAWAWVQAADQQVPLSATAYMISQMQKVLSTCVIVHAGTYSLYDLNNSELVAGL